MAINMRIWPVKDAVRDKVTDRYIVTATVPGLGNDNVRSLWTIHGENVTEQELQSLLNRLASKVRAG